MRVHIWTLCGRLDAVVYAGAIPDGLALPTPAGNQPSLRVSSQSHEDVDAVSAPCLLSAFVSKTQISDPAFLLSVVTYMVIISCTTHPS